jgi:hypothetical protein
LDEGRRGQQGNVRAGAMRPDRGEGREALHHVAEGAEADDEDSPGHHGSNSR